MTAFFKKSYKNTRTNSYCYYIVCKNNCAKIEEELPMQEALRFFYKLP